ncbi:MAG: PAS domain-containing protein, partial [Anaerolineaceae bacterium]|nr:PAS domain-containing protein [Anaerolineaceae bacterium]
MPIPLKVLIVEDFPPDADLMVLRLKQEGYQPDWQRVETEADFLAALNGEYDLILSDWSLPQFSGRRALQMRNESKRDVPFILISGSIGEETAVEMMREGADDYLLKDRPQRLGSAVSRVLERYREKEQRNKAEQALADSEAELRALFASMRDVVLVIDREGVYRKIAPTHPGLLVKPAAELLGKKLADVFEPAQAREFMQTNELVLESGETHSIEYELSIAGQPVWFECAISPMTPDSVVWVARNVTDRKQAERYREAAMQALRSTHESLKQSQAATLRLLDEVKTESEARQLSEASLKRAQKVARVGSWVWHIPTNRLEWSDEMYVIFGIDQAQFSGNLNDVIAKAIHPDDREAVDNSNRSVSEDGKPIPLEYRVIWPDGSVHTVWAEAGDIALDEAGNPLTLSGIVQDITERKKTEAEREAALDALKKAQQVARMGNWTWHIQTDRLDWSEEMFEIFGIHPDAFTGKWSDVVAQAIHPDDRAVIEKENELVVHEKKLAPQEYRVVWPDGSVHTIREESGELTLDEAGNPLTLIGIAQDITERKRAEAEREAALDALKKAQKVAKVGSWTWHIPANHLEWSDEMFVIFGINQNEFSGKLANAAASVIHPDDRMVYENANLSVLKDKKPVSKEYR